MPRAPALMKEDLFQRTNYTAVTSSHQAVILHTFKMLFMNSIQERVISSEPLFYFYGFEIVSYWMCVVGGRCKRSVWWCGSTVHKRRGMRDWNRLINPNKYPVIYTPFNKVKLVMRSLHLCTNSNVANSYQNHVKDRERTTGSFPDNLSMTAKDSMKGKWMRTQLDTWGYWFLCWKLRPWVIIYHFWCRATNLSLSLPSPSSIS